MYCMSFRRRSAVEVSYTPLVNNIAFLRPKLLCKEAPNRLARVLNSIPPKKVWLLGKDDEIEPLPGPRERIGESHRVRERGVDVAGAVNNQQLAPKAVSERKVRFSFARQQRSSGYGGADFVDVRISEHRPYSVKSARRMSEHAHTLEVHKRESSPELTKHGVVIGDDDRRALQPSSGVLKDAITLGTSAGVDHEHHEAELRQCLRGVCPEAS